MFKVICINDGKLIGDDGIIKTGNGLICGNEYTVIRVIPPIYKQRGFVLAEVKSSHRTGAFLESRFAPLSGIDEIELAQQREHELVKI